LLLLFSAGLLPTKTVGDPGAQGAVNTGTHGAGVSTPSAAAVALATAGLEGVVHIPKVGRLAGVLSIMVATGIFMPSVCIWDVTTSGHGAAPNEHMHILPLTTGNPMLRSFL